jgi:hypothetical protein
MIPFNFPYKRSEHVELFDVYTGQTVVPNGTTASLASARVASQVKRGFITALGLASEDNTSAQFASLVFQIRVNGVADRYYQNIVGQLSPYFEPRPIAPIMLRSGDLFDVFVANNDVAGHIVSARLMGFYDFVIGPTG